MKSASSRGFVTLVLLSFAAPAQAQSTGFALPRYVPSERGSEWFAQDTLDLRGHLRWNAGLVVDGAYRPLAVYDASGNVTEDIVRHQVFMHPSASLVLWDRLRLGLDIPVAVYQDGSGGTVNGVAYPPPGSPAFGDVRLGGDARILGTYRGLVTVAGGLQVHLPTGSRASYTSDGSVRVEPRVLAAGEAGPFVWGARLGLMYRNLQGQVDESPLGSEFTFGASAGVRVLRDGALVVGPELFGSTVLSGGGTLQSRKTPVDGILGAHYTFLREWRVGAGAGTGLTRGYGAPEARWMISLERVAPFEESPKASEPPPPPAPVPPPPPPDTDADGVLDAEDACPTEPGLRTKDPKTHGCPDPDRDRDGILNAVDACPDVPGSDNPDPARKGCPMARVEAGEIKILEQVKFVTNSAAIQKGKDSEQVLQAVLKVLETHPEIAHVRVEGHTDSAGDAAYNKQLSQRRAESVVAWLSQHGIPRERLSAAGFGLERPIADNVSPEGRRINRRVEFHLE